MSLCNWVFRIRTTRANPSKKRSKIVGETLNGICLLWNNLKFYKESNFRDSNKTREHFSVFLFSTNLEQRTQCWNQSSQIKKKSMKDILFWLAVVVYGFYCSRMLKVRIFRNKGRIFKKRLQSIYKEIRGKVAIMLYHLNPLLTMLT